LHPAEGCVPNGGVIILSEDTGALKIKIKCDKQN